MDSVTSLRVQNRTNVRATDENYSGTRIEGGRDMARLIEFYVPRNFKPPKRQSVTLVKSGKLIEFPRAIGTKSA
jgi:hypothetical protein